MVHVADNLRPLPFAMPWLVSARWHHGIAPHAPPPGLAMTFQWRVPTCVMPLLFQVQGRRTLCSVAECYMGPRPVHAAGMLWVTACSMRGPAEGCAVALPHVQLDVNLGCGSCTWDGIRGDAAGASLLWAQPPAEPLHVMPMLTPAYGPSASALKCARAMSRGRRGGGGHGLAPYPLGV